MLLSSPLPRGVQPGYHEGSSLRSVRDTDATARQWIKNNDTAGQTWIILRALNKLHREVDKIRRRVPGGGGGSGTVGVDYQGEYDPNGPGYAAKVIVQYTPDGEAPGTFISNQSVPKGVAPDTGLPYWSAFNTPVNGVWG